MFFGGRVGGGASEVRMGLGRMNQGFRSPKIKWMLGSFLGQKTLLISKDKMINV